MNSDTPALTCPLFLSTLICLRAGSQASPQDRFLVMAAEMDNGASQELVQFWKDVPKAKIMEHRYCSVT